MTNTPGLLDQLANLTAIRDIELLEFSLMKTIDSFFSPRSISMLKMDRKNRPRTELLFAGDRCRITHEHIVISDGLLQTFSQLIANREKEYKLRQESVCLSIYHILETRSAQTFLVITTEEELSGMDSYLVAGVLQVYRNFCDLLHYAQTDILTGLANRKTFDECIVKINELILPEADEFPNDRRTAEPLGYWLAMLDIDHFKAVNDRFGHLYGDEVLVLLAQMLKSVFREDDMIFRFGGEEFVILLRCSRTEGCRTALERMRKAVEDRAFPRIDRVTVSIGATRIDRNAFSMTLIDQADQALYYSKQNGRNRVTLYEDLSAMGLASKPAIETGDITLF